MGRPFVDVNKPQVAAELEALSSLEQPGGYQGCCPAGSPIIGGSTKIPRRSSEIAGSRPSPSKKHMHFMFDIYMGDGLVASASGKQLGEWHVKGGQVTARIICTDSMGSVSTLLTCS